MSTSSDSSDKKLAGLLGFAERVAGILIEIEVVPVLYGSYAARHYAGDVIVVHDIDVYVPEGKLPIIAAALRENKIETEYYSDEHTVHAIDGKLKVEIDSLEHYYHGPQDFLDFNLGNAKIRIISLKQLTYIYKYAMGVDPEPEKYIKKYEILSSLLG